LDYSQGLYEAIVRAHEAGLLMVAAAGNEKSAGQGNNLDENPMYPACDDGEENMVIGVAATDSVDQKADFSSYGTRCVDIAAPGVSFYSTVTFAPTKKIMAVFLINILTVIGRELLWLRGGFRVFSFNSGG
jgi:subtilisin family serine protease